MTSSDVIKYTVQEEYAERIPKGTALLFMEYTGRNQQKISEWLAEYGVKSEIKEKSFLVEIDMVGSNERTLFELRKGVFPAVYVLDGRNVSTVFYRNPSLFIKVRKHRNNK